MTSKKHQKKTLRQRIAHALTDRKILHFRYDAHLRQQVYKRLNALQKLLINRISAIGVEALPAKKLDKLLTELQTEIAKTYQETTAYTQYELSGFLSLEAAKISQLYNDEIGFDLFNDVPKERIKAIKNVAVIEGQPLEAWWNKQRADLAFKFEGIIRSGVAEGKQNGQLAIEVRELMSVSRRTADTLVITAVAKVADTAHEALRDANLDILHGEEHLSTLDMRTSTVCQVRDGKRWDLDKKPIGHNIPYKRPPLHPRCRSILQLVTKSWEELGVQEMDEMPTSTRASMDGPVDERINYESWLREKTFDEQQEVLGKDKVNMWRGGKITFSDMLDQSGRPLTVEQLREKTDPNYIRLEVDTLVLRGTKFTKKQLDRKFKHIEDFGFDNSKKNPKMLKQYQMSIIEHLNDAETVEFGKYREDGSRVFYNKRTGMAVVIGNDNQFITAFIPKDDPDENRFQLSNYLENGYLQ